MKSLTKGLWREQRLLLANGAVFVALSAILAGLVLVDPTEILGINRWIKPIKFAVSIAIYSFTLAVYLFYLPGYARSKSVLAWQTVILLGGEVLLITMQSARGTTSHFNVANPFDAFVFSAMGVMIVLSTLFIVYLIVIYFRADIELPKAVVCGMRLGMIVFVIGSIQGGYMSTQTGHAVGVTDGGPGLPFVNWSTEVGDLRVAHFMGLHAFQAIPLFAVAMTGLSRRFAWLPSVLLTVIFALAYFLAFTLIFAQALLGRPLSGG